jgi:hypothetical protein
MRTTAFGLAIAVAVCALTVPVTASAHEKRPSINRIEHRQQVRIRQSVRSGELTRAEAARLEAEQARIRVDERFDRADGGKLTGREREQLYKELRRASTHIHNQKHDRQDRN